VFWVARRLFEGLQGFKLRKSLCLRQAVGPQLRAGGNEGFNGSKVVFGHPVTGAHQALCAFVRIIGAGVAALSWRSAFERRRLGLI
jgi:hypothetical protein